MLEACLVGKLVEDSLPRLDLPPPKPGQEEVGEEVKEREEEKAGEGRLARLAGRMKDALCFSCSGKGWSLGVCRVVVKTCSHCRHVQFQVGSFGPAVGSCGVLLAFSIIYFYQLAFLLRYLAKSFYFATCLSFSFRCERHIGWKKWIRNTSFPTPSTSCCIPIIWTKLLLFL